MKPRAFVRTPVPALLVLIAACAGGQSSCGGCGCLTPLKTDYTGPKVENAVTLRVSKDGFDYVNQNWRSLIGAFTQNPLNIDVPCSSSSGAYICDQNHNNKCDAGEHCTVNANITDVKLAPAPRPPNQAHIDGTAKLVIKTGDMHFTKEVCVWIACCTLKCHANFDSTRSGTGYETFTLPIDFSIDPTWGKLTRLDIGTISGIDQLESGDLKIGVDSGICSNIACGVGDISFIKDIIVDQFIKPALKQQVSSQARNFTCRACDKNASCGAGPLENTCCPSGSSCQSSVCEAGGGRCVPKMLGMQGEIDPATALASLGAPPQAGGPTIPIFAAAGGTVGSDSGLNLGVLGGVEAKGLAACVPDLPLPTLTPVTVPDFDNVGPAGYHVGFGVAHAFLQSASYQLHRSGALCLSIGSKTTSLLNTGTLKVLLPSLDLLTGGADSSAQVVVRPSKPPTLRIGEGTFDPMTKKPIDPLLTLEMKDVNIDMYAFMEDRFARLFTLTVDMKVPLSLIVEGGCSGSSTAVAQKVTVALGDLKQLVTNVRTSNSELLAEDPAVLGQLIPLVVGLAEPALATAIKPIDLPDVNGLLIKINELKGATPSQMNPGEFEHLVGFAQLRVKGGVCASFTPRTVASLAQLLTPTPEALKAGAGASIPWPTALIDVAADGRAAGGYEFAYRVDGGFWSTWFDGPRLTVSHPALLVQGSHLIEVRARVAGDPDTIEQTPAQVRFAVDYAGPDIALKEDRAQGLLQVAVHDAVSAPERLEVRYTLGEESPTGWGPARPVDLKALADAGGRLTVEARDEAGHSSSKSWRMPMARLAKASSGAGQVAGASNAEPATGCSTGSGSFLPGLFGIAALLRRRSKRS